MNNIFIQFLPQFLPNLDLVHFVQVSTEFNHIKHQLYSKIPTTYTCYDASEDGHLQVLKWIMREKEYSMDEYIWERAATGGHLEVLEWLRTQTSPSQWCLRTCLHIAAMGGHLEVIKWVRNQGCSWDIWACSYAAGGGHLDVLKYLREQGCPWDEQTCISAACCGHLHVVKWALRERCPFSVSIVIWTICMEIYRFPGNIRTFWRNT